jgi:hypothetical protein
VHVLRRRVDLGQSLSELSMASSFCRRS